MLKAVFARYAKKGLDFDDFMLELHVKMGKDHFAAVTGYKGTARFKTYLSTIARNLLFDMGAREKPTIDIDAARYLPYEDDYEREQMLRLLELINAYPNEKTRFVLFKTLEGYSSKEIAAMLAAQSGKEVKPSYVDTLRSRAYGTLRAQVQESVKERVMASTVVFEESAAVYYTELITIPTGYQYTIIPALRQILG
jgi:RNA polymerase sigma factor (sigma-70 family)